MSDMTLFNFILSLQKMWNAQHEDGAQKLAETITDLKGFYVKTAQIISARQDLFPKQYTDALSGFTDNLDPMPASMAKAVVIRELLMPGETFEDVFSEFDDAPLGAASVAQVHRAVLTENMVDLEKWRSKFNVLPLNRNSWETLPI